MLLLALICDLDLLFEYQMINASPKQNRLSKKTMLPKRICSRIPTANNKMKPKLVATTARLVLVIKSTPLKDKFKECL